MCYAPVEEPEISWSFVCLFVFIFSAVAMLDLLERGGRACSTGTFSNIGTLK